MIIPSPEYFQHMYEYVKWADFRHLEATRALSDEEYHKDRGWSFGTIHRVLLHELSAQSIWLDRFLGRPQVWLYDDPKMAKREALEPAWTAAHQRFTSFLHGLDSGALAKSISYTNLRNEPFSWPLWHLLTHTFNHATYHRGQLNSMLQLAGAKPASTDYQVFILKVPPKV